MQLNNQKFTATSQVLDGNDYSECAFDRCKIIYRGGQLPSLNGCSFNDCTWHFEEGAERTLVFLRMLYHGMGTNGPTLVESAINQIREPLK